MLSGAELSVGLRVTLGDEDGVPAEPAGASGFERYASPHLPEEDTRVTIGERDRHRTDGPGQAVLLTREHIQDPLVSDGRQKPFRKRPGKTIPGLDDEPRILDQDRRVRGAYGFACGGGLYGGDLCDVEVLKLGEIQGDTPQLDTQYLSCFAGLGVV